MKIRGLNQTNNCFFDLTHGTAKATKRDKVGFDEYLWNANEKINLHHGHVDSIVTKR